MTHELAPSTLPQHHPVKVPDPTGRRISWLRPSRTGTPLARGRRRRNREDYSRHSGDKDTDVMSRPCTCRFCVCAEAVSISIESQPRPSFAMRAAMLTILSFPDVRNHEAPFLRRLIVLNQLQIRHWISDAPSLAGTNRLIRQCSSVPVVVS